MKAVVMTGIGGVDKLEYVSIDTPKPKDDEVIIKVLYCGVNHLDLLIRQGKRPGPKTFPHILGSEIIGQLPSKEIVAVYPWTFCGKCNECKNGREQMCDVGGTIGRTKWGGYAEYVAVPKKNVVKIPLEVKPEEACSVILAGTTAHHLVQKANIADYSTVLVTGATGGVGTLVVQLLKRKKCVIIAATSHENKKPSLIKLGVDHVVSVANLVEDIKLLFPQGIKYAIDIIGGDTWSKTVKILGKDGTMVFCSTSKEEVGKVDIREAFAREVNILGSNGGTMKDFKEMLFLLQKGILQPVIDEVLPLKDAPKAHEKLEKQEVFGKMLLRLDRKSQEHIK